MAWRATCWRTSGVMLAGRILGAGKSVVLTVPPGVLDEMACAHELRGGVADDREHA